MSTIFEDFLKTDEARSAKCRRVGVESIPEGKRQTEMISQLYYGKSASSDSKEAPWIFAAPMLSVPFEGEKEPGPNSDLADFRSWAEMSWDRLLRAKVVPRIEVEGGCICAIVVPKEFCSDDARMQNFGESDELPTYSHMNVIEKLFRPVFSLISTLPTTLAWKERAVRPPKVRTIGIGCFGRMDILGDRVLGSLAPSLPSKLGIIPLFSESKEPLARLWDRAEIEEYFEQLFGEECKLNKEAKLVYILLAKRALVEMIDPDGSESKYTVPQQAVKGGRIACFSVHTQSTESDEDNETPEPEFVWCKFGSYKDLKHEKIVLERMSRGPALKDFLYDGKVFKWAPADYTALWVTGDVGRLYKDFEDSLTSLERALNPTNITEALKKIDEFLERLHVSPDDKNPQLPQMPTDVNPWKFHTLLSTRKATVPSGEQVPLKMSKNADGKGYKLLYIRPRDDQGEVQFVLEKPDSSGERVHLHWAEPHWRWWLWRDGILNPQTKDGENVLLTGSDPEPRPRRNTHLQKLGNLVREPHHRVLEAISSHVDGQITLWLKKDLHPHWAHGDFHPRNTLFAFPDASERGACKLKVIDVTDALSCESNSHELPPMAFDLASFEIDMKAKSLLKGKSKEKPSDEDKVSIWQFLMKSETAIWNELRREQRFVDPAASRSTTAKKNRIPWSAPKGILGKTNLKRNNYWVAALWRHLALHRLSDVSQRLPLNKIPNGWTAIKSYAQSLFFCSIGYLEFLDPDSDWVESLCCWATACGALDVLESSTSDRPRSGGRK